jgi:hypothetical protein
VRSVPTKSAQPLRVFGVFPVAMAVFACSSTSAPGSAATTDAGTQSDGASTSDAAASDGGGRETVSEACAVFVPYVARCKSMDACSTAQAISCSTFSARYSDAFLGALTACGNDDCTAVGKCVAEHEAMVAPTPTQERIKTEYCAVCAADCGSFFDISGVTAAQKDGPGAVVRHASDEAATRIEAKCAKNLTAMGCGSSFFLCSFDEGESPVLPACM